MRQRRSRERPEGRIFAGGRKEFPPVLATDLSFIARGTPPANAYTGNMLINKEENRDVSLISLANFP